MWLLIFFGGALYLAYHRVSLRAATIAVGRGAGRLQRVRQRLAAVDHRPLDGVRRAGAAQHRRHPAALRHQAVPDGVPAHAAHDVRHRARGARGRHRVVGRRAVHRQARLAEAAVGARRRSSRAEEQAFLDGPCEELCRMLDDWDITHRRADLPPRGLGLPQEEGLLRDDHPEAVRRPRVLGLRAFLRAREAREPQRHAARRRSRCRTRSAPPNCCCTTAPRNRRTTTCRGSRAARTCPASR